MALNTHAVTHQSPETDESFIINDLINSVLDFGGSQIVFFLLLAFNFSKQPSGISGGSSVSSSFGVLFSQSGPCRHKRLTCNSATVFPLEGICGTSAVMPISWGYPFVNLIDTVMDKGFPFVAGSLDLIQSHC